MLLAFIIAIIQQITFISYLIETNLFNTKASDEMHVLMMAVALFTAVLSIPSFFWNINMVKEAKEKRDIISTIVSVVTFLFGVGFLVYAFVARIHSMGGTIF